MGDRKFLYRWNEGNRCQEENSEIYFENMIYNLRDQKPDLIDEVRKITPRIRIRRKLKTSYDKNVLVYAKRRRICI